MKVFNAYASFYDTLYREKDYAAECDFLEEIFRRHSPQPVKSILDLGCGTGGHAVLMAKRGYAVSGIDLSDKMLRQAGEKALAEKLNIDFRAGDVRNFNLGKKFDAIASMFAVIGYQTTNQDVEDTFRSVRRHLNPGGLFIFDVWFGPAVLIQQPAERVKIIETEDGRVVRIAWPEMDIMNHTVQVNYKLLHISGNEILSETNESHLMRFFFPQELNYFLKKNGFSVETITPFLAIGGKPMDRDWNITVVAKASEGGPA